MEFTGRIAKVLPMRSGTSQKTGNEWQALPFIFEYFEHDFDRYADKVLLETFDTNVIPQLKEGMEIRCGFGHNVRTYQKDGRDIIINEVRLYKIESVNKAAQQQMQQPAPNGVGTTTGQPAPNGAGTAAGAAQGAQESFPQAEGEDDELPF